MGNRASGEASGQVAPLDAESQGVSLGGEGSSWSSSTPTWMRLPGLATEETEEEDLCKCLNLSYTQRVWGFCICFSLGMIISIMSSFLVFNPAKFALPYSIGNVLSILSTGFLVGPKRQCRTALAPTRIWAFLIFIGAVICTLISALVLQKGLLTLLFVVVQFFSGLWYTASYIPYGRAMLAKCGTAIVGQATAQVTGS